MNADTCTDIGAKEPVWLKAEFDVLMRRIRRRRHRPPLKTEDLGATLRRLMEQRYPVYGWPISPCSRARFRTTRSSTRS
jgi:shikimate kinase